MKTMVAAIVVRGFTEWHVSEYKTIGRFRGTTTKSVSVRDPSTGKPAARAERGVNVTVRCADGTAYVFRRHLPEFMTEHVGGNGYTFTASLYVHGHQHTVYEEQIPALVMKAYRDASRSLRAALRINRSMVNALPRYRQQSGEQHVA